MRGPEGRKQDLIRTRSSCPVWEERWQDSSGAHGGRLADQVQDAGCASMVESEGLDLSSNYGLVFILRHKISTMCGE